jgi:hypothetical protein
VLWPTLSVPPPAPAGAGSVAVLLGVALPFPLPLCLPLVAVVLDAAVGDPPVSDFADAPRVEPLSDPARLFDGLAIVGLAAGDGLLDSAALVAPPVDGGELVRLGAETAEADGLALRVARRRRGCELARTRDSADDGTGAERVGGAAEVRRAGALTGLNPPVPSNARPAGGTSLTTRARPSPAPLPREGHASNAMTGPISRTTQIVPAIREPETATPASVSRTLRIPPPIGGDGDLL